MRIVLGVTGGIAAYKAAEGAELTEDTNRFYFTAGIVDEAHGLLGKITKP